MQRLLSNNRPLLNAWAMTAAFSTYFFMYMFRKPFTAAAFDSGSDDNWDNKAILVSSQVLGYFCSKLIGIRVIAQMPAGRRAIALLVFIAISEAALLLFAIVPSPWHVVAIFLNGLPLGMVFGLVLGFLEGRRLTETLIAGLCASFIVASGVAKSVGQSILTSLTGMYGISLEQSERWMPVIAGGLFLVPIGISTWMLAQIPPPDAQDAMLRSQRSPMSSYDRRAMLRQYGFGLAAISLFYLLVTVLRSMRDDFAPQILSGMGAIANASDYSVIDSQVAFFVLAVNGMTSAIRGNRAALQFSLAVSLLGFGITAVALTISDRVTPISFMVLVGAGLYLPYVAVHTTVFERLIALTRDRGNIGYLMYIVDSIGYLAYVVVLFLPKTAILGDQTADNAFYQDFHRYCWTGLTIGSAATLVAMIYFYRLRAHPDHPHLESPN